MVALGLLLKLLAKPDLNSRIAHLMSIPHKRKHFETQPEEPEFFEKVVTINRCAKVVKGGRRFSFSALVVTGDQEGRVGVGYGKAKEVPESIRKATEKARKNMGPVQVLEDTIPHQVVGEADGGKVLLRPASPGTGVIAGGGVRAVLEAAGVKNVLSKSLGSNNHLAVVNATLAGLQKLRSPDLIRSLREYQPEQADA
jgi:small subunit ribosomal protein S5